MIIKSSQRAGHRNLAIHLVKAQDIDGTPQTVTFTGSRDLLIDETLGTHQIVEEALQDMQILAMASQRCQKDLYHISISPDKEMSAADWATAWDMYEQEFGLSHLPYIEVMHAKDSANGERREPHVHRVYERVDTTTGLAVHLSHTRVRNEKVARLLEYALGHELTVGKHNRSVMQQLLAEGGAEDVVRWMQQGQADVCDRPVAAQTYQDVMMEKRTALPTEEAATVLQTCYESTSTGLEFVAEIQKQGFEIAQGNRGFVIVDGSGGIHSPRRRLGVKAQELRERWSDIPKEQLEPVDSVVQRRKRAAGYDGCFRKSISGNVSVNGHQESLTGYRHIQRRKWRRKKKQKVMAGRGSWKQRLVDEEERS